MVRANLTLSIEHELKEKYQKLVGEGRMSDDIEQYMKSKVEEQQ